ncbi:MAG TPA: radical SAM protein [Thermoanaerobaculia bacterium]|nr:radical SAM protein [Thermoanaerobaculia bacterium]
MPTALFQRIKNCYGGYFNFRPSAGPARGTWVEESFGDFIAKDGNQTAMLLSIAAHAQQVVSTFDVSTEQKRRALAENLLNACAWIDDGNVWHSDLGFRSYVDVSLQVKVLRIFIDRLVFVSRNTVPVDAHVLTELVLEYSPNSRAALLVQAEFLLEKGEVDSAIERIDRALRVQAVCTSAQRLLFRAYQAKRDNGSSAEELKVLDYDLKDKFCHVPFTHLSTGWKGSSYACTCPAWVPFPIGNVLTAESGDAIWNSEMAVEIRRSVLDGDFSYCSRTLCSFITAQKLPRKSEIVDPVLRGYIENRTTTLAEVPRMFELNHDTTCNLACPSCRTEILVAKADEQDSYSRAKDRVILPLLQKVQGLSYISGGGEAFASRHYRAILSALNRRDYPGLHLLLITNGLLVTPDRWNEFPDLAEMVKVLFVSIDAARAETYEKLRRPGKWQTLMANLEFIAGMRRSGMIRSLTINFVVQKENFREMLDFLKLGQSLGVDQIWFQRVVNYGAYDEATFADVNVTSPRHPDHAELLEILRNPILKNASTNMQMLMSLLPEVVASEEPLEFLLTSAAPR